MKRLMLLATTLLLSLLLALPAVAAKPGKNQNQSQSTQGQQVEKVKGKGKGKGKGKVTVPPESEGRRLHKAYFQKLDAMRQRRDAASELRFRNLTGNNPGNTGL